MDISDFSIILNLWGPRPATHIEIVDVARHAEELGFHMVGLTHLPLLPHPAEHPPAHLAIIPESTRDHYIDPLTVLPLIATSTSRIRFGFNIFITPWVHPFVIAKYLASLDVIGSGRLIAGFGLGVAPPPSFECKSLSNIGLDSRQRGAMSDEALEIIVALWRGEPPSRSTGASFRPRS